MPGFLSTLCHQWERLGPDEQADADLLDAWLDDLVGGSPAANTAAPSLDPRLTAAAAQVHALAASADASDGQITADRMQAQIWEEIMAHHSTSGRFVTGASHVTAQPARPARFHAPRLSQAATRWSPAFNVTMVLVLLVALFAGVAGFYGHHRSGSSAPTEPAQLAAIASPAPATHATTPAPVETPLATLPGSNEVMNTFGGALPTPSECTVKPLTIDEVMARLGYTPLSPEEQLATRNAAATQIASFDPNADLPGPGTPWPTSTYTPPSIESRQPTDAEMQGIVAAHRQLIACIMKRSPLQIWAMIDPQNHYWRDVAAFAAPSFSDPAIVRLKIEGFVSGKQWLFPDPTQMIPPLGFETPMVNPDPTTAHVSLNPDDGKLIAGVSMLYYSQRDSASSPYTTTQMASSYGRSAQDAWLYRYDPTLHRWLLAYHEGSSFQQG